jgi:hypothetical protein
MELIVGRLSYIAFLMDMHRYFMSRLSMALQRTLHHRFTYLRSCEKADLEVMLHFLKIVALKEVQ